MKSVNWLALCGVGLLIIACGKEEGAAPAASTPLPVQTAGVKKEEEKTPAPPPLSEFAGWYHDKFEFVDHFTVKAEMTIHFTTQQLLIEKTCQGATGTKVTAAAAVAITAIDDHHFTVAVAGADLKMASGGFSFGDARCYVDLPVGNYSVDWVGNDILITKPGGGFYRSTRQ